MAQEKSGSGKQDERDRRKAAGAMLPGGASADSDERRRRGGGWLLGGGGTNLIGLLLIAGLGLVTTIAIGQKEFLPHLFGIDLPVAVKTIRWGNSVVFPLEGKDKSGKEATFDFVTKTKDYTWVRGASNQVAFNGQPIGPADLQAQLFGPEVATGLAPSADLIAVGVASQEGSVAEENARAEQRGKTAADWMDKTVGAGKHIWVLNLGQFKSACSGNTTADTSWERPFVFVGARKQAAGVNLGEALVNAMNNKTNLPSTDCYSTYQLAKLH